MVSADPEAIGRGLGGLGSGGFGGGRTPLGPDLTSQFPDWHSLIQAFMLVKFSVGMSLAFTWLFYFCILRSNIFGGTNGGSNGTFCSTSVVCRCACSRSLLPTFPWKACIARGGEPCFSPWPGLHPFSFFFVDCLHCRCFLSCRMLTLRLRRRQRRDLSFGRLAGDCSGSYHTKLARRQA